MSAPAPVWSGFCNVGRHHACRGTYNGHDCPCGCHTAPEPGLRIGELCAGYGGLGMGVQQALGGELAWVSEYEPPSKANPNPSQGAAKILAHRFPGVPNLGDMTTVDWSAVEPVDILTGGTPCQDLSAAGKRLGMRAGTRSGLWASMCDAIDIIRPGLVVWENVRGALSAHADSAVEPCPICVGDERDAHLRALGRVVGDLSELGYVGRWVGVRASDVGAPHSRFRVFVAAWPAGDAPVRGRDGARPTHKRGERPGPTRGSGLPVAADAQGGVRSDKPGSDDAGRSVVRARTGASCRTVAGGAPEGVSVLGRGAGLARSTSADPDGAGLEGCRAIGPGSERPEPVGTAHAAAHAEGHGRHEGRPEPARLVGRPDAAISGDQDVCPACSDPVEYHDEGGFCAGTCGGNCQDPDLGRPGIWNTDDGTPPATHTDGDAVREQPVGIPGRGCAAFPGHAGTDASAHADSDRLSGQQGSTSGRDAVRADQRSDADRCGRDADADPASNAGRLGDGDGVSAVEWGPYAQAIHRWERVLGRVAPPPTELSAKGSPRLSPAFVEFMMGLPAGWVTGVPGLTRNEQLKCLGNGVLPAQAAHALRLLLADVPALGVAV